MAGATRLELATSGVTGRRSNQLNYDPEKYLVVPARRRSRSILNRAEAMGGAGFEPATAGV